jgi:hypothetical protein
LFSVFQLIDIFIGIITSTQGISSKISQFWNHDFLQLESLIRRSDFHEKANFKSDSQNQSGIHFF